LDPIFFLRELTLIIVFILSTAASSCCGLNAMSDSEKEGQNRHGLNFVPQLCIADTLFNPITFVSNIVNIFLNW
jgi:hypothetical protein